MPIWDSSQQKKEIPSSLGGEVAVVTGANRGIGRAVAINFARTGAHVVVNYRSHSEEAEQVVKECRSFGVNSISVKADIGLPDEVKDLLTAATELGLPSILVNNAGIALDKMFQDTSLKDWNQVLQTNLTGSFLCSQAILPYQLHKGWGRIINISSVWGIAGAATESAYSASKGGLISFTKALSKELASVNITVNAVAPGAVETDMIGRLSEDDMAVLLEEIPTGRLGKPDEVANLVTFLASRNSGYITGQVFTIDGGLIS